MNFTTYFSAREILGYGALFNLVLSDRSDGKTFNCKVRALEDYDKYGHTSVYMRRYDTEITPKMYNSFLNEVLEKDKYKYYADKYKFRYSKAGVEIKAADAPKEEPWQWLIYFIPLSKSGKLKSQLDISNIHTISFDEYMPLDHRYLKDEMLLLAEFWKSIDRDRDQTQLILLGNRIDPFCPFLSFFNIDLDIEQARLRTYRNGTLAIQIYVNKEHREQRAESDFATLMKDTDYESYDCGGVLYNYKLNIIPVQPNDTPLYSFISNGKEGTIWLGDTLIFSEKKRKDLLVLVDDMRNAQNDGREYRYVKDYNSSFREYFYSNKLALTNINLQPSVMALLRSR